MKSIINSYIIVPALVAAIIIVPRIFLAAHREIQKITDDTFNKYSFSRVDSMSTTIPSLKEYTFIKEMELYLFNNPADLNVRTCLGLAKICASGNIVYEENTHTFKKWSDYGIGNCQTYSLLTYTFFKHIALNTQRVDLLDSVYINTGYVMFNKKYSDIGSNGHMWLSYMRNTTNNDINYILETVNTDKSVLSNFDTLCVLFDERYASHRSLYDLDSITIDNYLLGNIDYDRFKEIKKKIEDNIESDHAFFDKIHSTIITYINYTLLINDNYVNKLDYNYTSKFKRDFNDKIAVDYSLRNSIIRDIYTGELRDLILSTLFLEFF